MPDGSSAKVCSRSAWERGDGRSAALTDESGTGEVRLGENVDPKGEAARGDVAKLLADAAESPEWVGKVLHMESVG